MKLYPEFKKLFSILFFIILLVTPTAFSYAQTAADVQNKIAEKDSDIKKLEQEIAQYQKQLNDIGQQKSSLNSILQQLDLTRKKLNADIAVTQNKIDKTRIDYK